MRIRHGKNLDDEMYHFLENSISRTIKHLANLTLTGAIEAHRFVEANDSIRNEVERAIRRIETSPQEIRETVRKHQQLFGVAILANASGWFIYIIPIIIVALFVMFFLNKCATAIKTLMFLPEDEMDKFLPPESLSTI